MDIVIRAIEKDDLPLIQSLWGDGDVMKFVGLPEGLVEPYEKMLRWYAYLQQNQADCMEYVIFDGDVFCGECFYDIDREHGNLASMDIKLFAHSRGKGIAYKALSYALEQAKLHGGVKAWVNPVPENEKAIRLYERLGFAPAAIPESVLKQEGEDGYIYMEKTL